jgi:naphthoate synthase
MSNLFAFLNLHIKCLTASEKTMVSEIFNENDWDLVEGYAFDDITFHKAKVGGTVRIAFNRPECRNAFRPKTVDELYLALKHAQEDVAIGVVILTGNGPSQKDGGWAFCSGGDQRVRGKDGYSMRTQKMQQG